MVDEGVLEVFEHVVQGAADITDLHIYWVCRPLTIHSSQLTQANTTVVFDEV